MHNDWMLRFAPVGHVTLGLQLQFAQTAAGCNMLQLWCVAVCSNYGVLQFAPTVVCYCLLQLWCVAVCSNCGMLQLAPTVVCCCLLQLEYVNMVMIKEALCTLIFLADYCLLCRHVSLCIACCVAMFLCV